MYIKDKPDQLVFAGILADVVIAEVMADGIQVSLYETSRPDVLLLNELYIPGSDLTVYIDIKTVLLELLKTDIPKTENLVTELFLENYTLKAFHIGLNPVSCSFSVINASIMPEKDVTTFLRHNFLTWQQQFRNVSKDSIVLLSYIAQEDSLFKVSVQYENGHSSEVSVVLSENDAKSFNVSPAFLCTYFNNEIKECKAWIETYSGYCLTEKVHYRLTNVDFPKAYLFTNSLGGIDSILFTGSYSQMLKTTAEIYSYNRKQKEGKTEISRIYKQNTGYLSFGQSEVVADFLMSKSRYLISGGLLIPIVIEETENEFVLNSLNAFEFEYRYSDQLPYLHISPKKGFSPDQLPPFFDKIIACFDQKKGNKIFDRTRGYVATLSDNETYIEFPPLQQDVMSKANNTFWQSDINKYDNVRKWKVDELTGTYTINYATDLCCRSLFFRDLTEGIGSVLPVIIYNTALSSAEIDQVLYYLKEYYFLEDKEDNTLLVDNQPSEGNNIFLTDNLKSKSHE